MAAVRRMDGDRVTRLPRAASGESLSGSLAEIRDRILTICPSEAVVAIRYDGALHVDIDVRGAEQAMLVETFLPQMLAGTIRNVRRSKSPGAFHVRVSAEILR